MRDVSSVMLSGRVVAKRRMVTMADVEQSESVTDNVPELTGEVVELPRSVLFACDDSEECERGAELLFDTMVKEGGDSVRSRYLFRIFTRGFVAEMARRKLTVQQCSG